MLIPLFLHNFLQNPSPTHSQLPEGNDLDWEDYNYKRDEKIKLRMKVVGDIGNPLVTLLQGIPDFKSAEFNRKALLRNLPILARDAAVQAPGKTIGRAMDDSKIGV